MTITNPPLDYASPRPPDHAGRGYLGLAAALALAVGFLGANSFADAAGLPAPRDASRDSGYIALRVLCGIVVFVVTFVVFSFLLRELRALAHTLARSSNRPSAPIALACVICGTACVIAALLVQLYGLRNPSGVSFGAAGFSVGAGAQGSVHTPLMAHIVSLMAFVLGIALVTVGIWSSMSRPSATLPLTNTAAAPPLP